MHGITKEDLFNSDINLINLKENKFAYNLYKTAIITAMIEGYISPPQIAPQQEYF